MDERDFARMMLDEPDDDGPRLAFADWLEEAGQAPRAEWARAGCVRSGIKPGDPASGPAIGREVAAWLRCKPPWWGDPLLPGVGEMSDRGLQDLIVRSRPAAARLGKAPWLSRAIVEGWLGVIRVEKCDDATARALASWKGPAREAPLMVAVVPQITDEGLAACLGLPGLWGLRLPAHAARNPSASRLGEASDLRELQLEVRNLDPVDASPIFEQVGRLAGLRRLSIEGRDFPADGDLATLGPLAGLRTLRLIRCSALTDAVLDWARGLPGLDRLTLWGCEGIGAGGVERFLRDRPGLAIDRP